MAKGYWVVTYRKINAPDKLAEYAKLAGPVIREAGGTFIVRGLPSTTYEFGVTERVVIAEFDSVELAVAAYESPAYKEALRVFDGAADRDFRIVGGAD
ncbi:DUF1330 domain-containing protein [Pararobbsia silviterrae]|uniref:DUF1330 domain-containing protein n=1 Tax=Pararobbsia silviterrae TaxID=1792498 RepID=A0A494XWV3_9BURK|nr:DUF1330 domain-containing protein [Pararobbsia silviterrae]RKP53476.1 DUF1330 domain-containing protein [Pararobbsia silviterrae]